MPLPALDFERLAAGPIRLGDSPEAAAPLGKPGKVRGKKGDETHEYEGFELQFQGGRLVCIKFDVDERTRVPIGDWHFARTTKPMDVHVWFGEPASDSTGGGDLRWIDYEREGATLALEFDAKGLSCVQLYAAGFA